MLIAPDIGVDATAYRKCMNIAVGRFGIAAAFAQVPILEFDGQQQPVLGIDELSAGFTEDKRREGCDRSTGNGWAMRSIDHQVTGLDARSDRGLTTVLIGPCVEANEFSVFPDLIRGLLQPVQRDRPETDVQIG